MRQLLTALLLTHVLFLLACGLDSEDSSLSADKESHLDLIIGASGWYSCGGDEVTTPHHSGVYYGIQKALESWKGENKPESIVSCFTFRGELRYTLNGGDVHVTRDINEYLAFVRDTVKRVGPRVSLVGHSHGGWLMMHTIRSLKDLLEVHSLNTIDAVSYRRCRVTRFIGNKHCHRPPTDFTEEELVDIRNRSGFWRHDYQRRSWILRSNRIDYAHHNVSHPQKTFYRIGTGAHSDMDDGEKVWKAVAAAVLKKNPTDQIALAP